MKYSLSIFQQKKKFTVILYPHYTGLIGKNNILFLILLLRPMEVTKEISVRTFFESDAENIQYSILN